MPSLSKKYDTKSSSAGIAKYSNNKLFDVVMETSPGKVEDPIKKISFLEERKKLGIKMVDPSNQNPYHDESFKPVRDVLKLEEVVKEKNKASILDIFCRKSRAQRLELAVLYKSTYSKDFTKNLHSLFKKNILTLFDVFASDLITAYAHSIKDAIDDKNYLCVLLLTRICPKEDLKEIGVVYKTLYKKQLENEFDSFPKGVKELCSYYYEFDFEPMLSNSEIETEVDKLIMNLKTKDVNFLATLFSRRQGAFVLDVCNLFYQKSEKTVLECFKDKMNTQAQECFSLLYDLVHDVPTTIGKYIAQNLESNSGSMLDLIVLRSEVDLGKIVQVFFEQNGCQLLDSCEKVLSAEKRTIAQYFLIPLTPS